MSADDELQLWIKLAPGTGRHRALDRRDEVVAHLEELGMRVSLEAGLRVLLVDGGVATLGERMAGAALAAGKAEARKLPTAEEVHRRSETDRGRCTCPGRGGHTNPACPWYGTG